MAITGPTLNENKTMLMSVDTVDSAAKSDFDAAKLILNNPTTGGNWKLFEEHKNAWHETWSRGAIEFEGKLQTSKIAWFAQYYILSSLPPLNPHQAPQLNQVYYGFTRTGLAKGGENTDYRGHMFWDSEMYILPAILLFHPELAKRMLRYRSYTAAAARQHAEAMGAEGYRFPWESAYTGHDVTPDSCINCREQQIFVSAAVAWAIRQYYTATYDDDYRTNPDYVGCDMTREIARFYANIAKYNSTKGRYDINSKSKLDSQDLFNRIFQAHFSEILESFSKNKHGLLYFN